MASYSEHGNVKVHERIEVSHFPNFIVKLFLHLYDYKHQKNCGKTDEREHVTKFIRHKYPFCCFSPGLRFRLNTHVNTT
jgi:hypothetical protein